MQGTARDLRMGPGSMAIGPSSHSGRAAKLPPMPQTDGVSLAEPR